MTEVKDRKIAIETINKAYSYSEYRELIDSLLKEGKTTGDNHSEAMLHFTKMNVHRMKRHDKHTELTDELKGQLEDVDSEWIWLVLSEAWCGDAAQSLPIINKMAEMNDKITFRLILRDENLEVMDQFLQNGRSRSIPKLICIKADTLEVVGDWGPRPQVAQELYDSLRNDADMKYQEVAERLQKWYADDKSEALQQEFLHAINEWMHS